jgi:hypothetical protein
MQDVVPINNMAGYRPLVVCLNKVIWGFCRKWNYGIWSLAFETIDIEAFQLIIYCF